MTCKAKQRGDEMHCKLCLRTWQIDEPRPPLCPERHNAPNSHTRSNIKQKPRRFQTIFERRIFDPVRYNTDGPKIY